MTDETPLDPPRDPLEELAPKAKARKAEPRKRELKSAKRKGGVPSLKAPKKKSKKWWWIGGGLVVAFFAAVFLVPKIGTARYGICKTYIELHDPYPEFIEYVEAEEDGDRVDIDYNRIDSFGQRTLNQMRCIFKNEGNVYELASVDLNGKANVFPLEDPAEVVKFNIGVPSLLKTKPSLIMPKGLPAKYQDYK